MAVKAVTGTELGYLRRDGQFSRFYLSIDQPTPVFQAVYNDVAQTDKVAHFAYTSPLGDLSDVLPGMTLAVGSGLGESDKGLARIRKAPSGATFYIGISSEIDFKPGDFLTVFDEFGLWPRHTYVSVDVNYVDYDIPYTDQHTNYAPVIVAGPDPILWLVKETVDVSFDASAYSNAADCRAAAAQAGVSLSACSNLT